MHRDREQEERDGGGRERGHSLDLRNAPPEERCDEQRRYGAAPKANQVRAAGAPCSGR